MLKGAGVTVDRGGRRVLRHVDFVVRGGEGLIVTGPNGSGKSTLLRAIAGLCPLAEGDIDLVGAPFPEGLHLVGHLNALKPQQSVLQNLAFWTLWQGGASESERSERAEDALDRVGLLALADLPAQFLSQGQRRRLALARLLASPRPVWLLDEPTAGLDVASRDMFAAAMGDHLAAGGVFIASTHEPLGLDAGTLDLTPE